MSVKLQDIDQPVTRLWRRVDSIMRKQCTSVFVSQQATFAHPSHPSYLTATFTSHLLSRVRGVAALWVMLVGVGDSEDPRSPRTKSISFTGWLYLFGVIMAASLLFAAVFFVCFPLSLTYPLTYVICILSPFNSYDPCGLDDHVLGFGVRLH